MTDLPFDLKRDTAALTAGLESRFQLVKYDPDIWGGAYQLLVPKGWSAETNFPTRIDVPLEPLPLGLFLPPDADGSVLISLSGCRMGMEVNLEDWIDHLLAREGRSAEDGEWIRTPLGLCWDCGTVSGTAPRREFSRIMAWASSGRLFFLTGRCVESEWTTWQDAFLAAGITLQLTAPEERAADMLEGWSEWESPDDPAFGFAYPQSWLAEPVAGTPDGIGAVDLRLVDEEGAELLGYLRIKATDLKKKPGVTAAKLLSQAISEVGQAGIRVGEEDFVKSSATDYANLKPGHEGTWITQVERDGKRLEVRVGVRRHPEMAFTVTLIGSAQDDQPYLWMRAKRAFEIVESSNWDMRSTKEPVKKE